MKHPKNTHMAYQNFINVLMQNNKIAPYKNQRHLKEQSGSILHYTKQNFEFHQY